MVFRLDGLFGTCPRYHPKDEEEQNPREDQKELYKIVTPIQHKGTGKIHSCDAETLTSAAAGAVGEECLERYVSGQR